MKIRTKTLDYDKVMALPRPEHVPPRRPDAPLRALIRALSAADLKKTRFSYTTERMDALGPGPYLIVMNHSSFIDLEIAAHIFRSEPFCIVCTSDGFVGKEALLRRIGCIPTNKFVTDLQLLADMACALREKKCSVLLFPEASYSFDGRATPLPRKLGVMLKKLDVPVIGVLTEGAFARDPLYNCLQKRDVKVSAHVHGLFSRKEIRERSVAELDAALDEMFSFDNFAWQRDNGIVIGEPFRADGLERILYKCPHCLTEGETVGAGVTLRCRHCGEEYELDTLGQLVCHTGEAAFTHIPDWYSWEREEVRRELEAGAYRLETDVEIGMLVDYKAIYMVGAGHLTHDPEGFRLTGCQDRLHFERPAKACYSLYADYYWYELGDIICIGDDQVQYYCFPQTSVPVAKARLATEERYKMLRNRRSSTKVSGHDA